MNIAITVPQFNSIIAGILFGSRKKGPVQCLGSQVAAGENPSLRPQSNATTSRSWWVWASIRVKKKGTGAMSGKPGRSGRKSFVATPEQRNNVKILVGLGVPQAMICQLVVNPQTGKPLDEGTLKKHFPREIAVGVAELHARMGSFMVANIFGMTPPAGTQPIKNESSPAMLSIFFAKTRW